MNGGETLPTNSDAPAQHVCGLFAQSVIKFSWLDFIANTDAPHARSPQHVKDWSCDACLRRRAARFPRATEGTREDSLQRGRAFDALCAGLCGDRQGLFR